MTRAKRSEASETTALLLAQRTQHVVCSAHPRTSAARYAARLEGVSWRILGFAEVRTRPPLQALFMYVGLPSADLSSPVARTIHDDSSRNR
jgi:hypothetical protein